jgi:protein-disulfide isomerase
MRPPLLEGAAPLRPTSVADAVLLVAALTACGGSDTVVDNSGAAAPEAAPQAVPAGTATPVDGSPQEPPVGTGSPPAAEPSVPADPPETVEPPDATQKAVAASFVFPRKGPEDAVLVIYEFADYRCPYCRQFATDTLPLLAEEFMGPDGQVALEFVDFPISDHGVPAVVSSEAAHCANEVGAYWEMHDAIYGDFAKMNDLHLEDEEASIDHLVGLAEGIGLEAGPMRECLETQRYRPTLASLFRDARDAEIEVTPTLIIGDEVVLGFQPYDQLRPVVERQLALALGTQVATVTPRPSLTPTAGP